MNNIHVKNLLKTCNSKKTPKWYSDAFGVLINYYIDLLDITVDSNHINLLGQVLNCIINDLNQIPTETDLQNMQTNINSSTSNVKSMASGFININYVIIYEILQYW